MANKQVDPLAECFACLIDGVHHKHDVVIEGIPLCTTHAEEALAFILLGPENNDV